MKFYNLMAMLCMGLTLGLTACNEDDDSNDNQGDGATTSSMKIEFENVWGNNEHHFHLMDDFTHPETAEVLNFTMFRYYVSNIVLHGTNGNDYAQPESYYLIDLDHDNMLTELTLTDVPVGSYSGISFIIGVDSLRNVSGAQTGALDPANGMFWNWNSGYIFVKAEGASSSVSNPNFTYHLGGFMGPDKSLQELEFTFDGDILDIEGGAVPTTHIVARVDQIWTGTSTENMGTVTMPGPMAGMLSSNFASGFRFDHNHH